MSYPLETDEHGNAIPPETKHAIKPSKRVPKKYWKYADKFPTRQLYKVYWATYGLIFTCIECGREIPSLEKFRRLCFREPRSMFARKVCIPLCKDCDAGLKREKPESVKKT